MIAKIIKNLENRMKKMQKSINKDLEELKTKHTETNNTITEFKNTLERICMQVRKQYLEPDLEQQNGSK